MLSRFTDGATSRGTVATLREHYQCPKINKYWVQIACYVLSRDRLTGVDIDRSRGLVASALTNAPLNGVSAVQLFSTAARRFYCSRVHSYLQYAQLKNDKHLVWHAVSHQSEKIVIYHLPCRRVKGVRFVSVSVGIVNSRASGPDKDKCNRTDTTLILLEVKDQLQALPTHY